MDKREVNYTRVNISTATSPARYNEYGERVGEVEMLLPSNLISANNVESARMAVMKMKVPLTEIPAASLPVTRRSGESFGILETTARIGVINAEVSANGTLEFQSASAITIGNANKVVPVTVVANHINDGVYPDEPSRELSSGIHTFKSMSEFLFYLNGALQQAFDLNYIYSAAERDTCNLAFSCNSDNSITLDAYCGSVDHCVIPHGGMVFNTNPLNMSTSSGARYCYPEEPTVRNNGRYSGFFIIVNYEIFARIPSLPWIKVKNDGRFTDASLVGDDYFYALDTRQAKINISNCNAILLNRDARYIPSKVSYHFVESDALSISDISSIILCMNGGTFNQQVYPINISPQTMSAAQTTSVPIIEVYYPLWTRPSDTTTEMVISRTEFTNAAPIRINPSLLKERAFTFKLYYITHDGTMHEMYLPVGEPFSFQLCFETVSR